MVRSTAVFAALGLLCLASCGKGDSDDKSKKSESTKPDKSDKNNNTEPGDKGTASAQGCQSDKDCKGYRICEAGKCVDQKKPDPTKTKPDPDPRLPAPPPTNPTGASACKPLVEAVCKTCGAGSPGCTAFADIMKAPAGSPMPSLIAAMCQNSSSRIKKFQSKMSPDETRLACMLFGTMVNAMKQGKAPPNTNPNATPKPPAPKPVK